jgi:mRNA-degrading endonuclease RelE of RelBE toxin-antitoxin system
VYEVEWSDEAEADRQSLPVFARRRVTAAVAQLPHQAEIETRNRKRLRRRLGGLTDAEWNLRIGDLRVLYRIVDGRIVRILRVILKGTATTDDALTRVK